MESTHCPSLALRTLLVVCALAVVSLLYLPLPILPQLARAYGMGATAAAGVVSAFGFAYALGFLIFGPLSDRLGRRKVMVWGLSALALVTALLALVELPASWLLAGRALQGLAAASFPPVAIAYLAERGSARQRVWSVAWMSTAFLSAGLLGQIYGGEVAGRRGLGAALLPLCAIYAATAWRLLATPAESPPLRSGVPSPLAGYRAIGQLLSNPKLRRVYGPALLLLMCFVAFYMGVDMHLGQALRARGMTPLAVRALALPAFLAPLAVAAVMPRWGTERVVMAGLFVATAGLALGALAAGGAHVHGLLAASVVFVAGIGISVPGLIARVASVADAPVRGLAVAFYTFVLFVGASLGPWLAQQSARLSMQSALLVLAALQGGAALYAASGRKDQRPAVADS
ncbi:MAG: MFS transporter [Burkholderiaceae bacterium]|jgi:MFS family permease|nr:MFS transporter [Burkholderiaceae bacterium]